MRTPQLCAIWCLMAALVGCDDGGEAAPLDGGQPDVADGSVVRPDGALDQDAARPGTDAARSDAARPDAEPTPDAFIPDGQLPDAAPPPITPTHAREFRGVWIASVFNINFPSRAGLDVATQQAELRALLDVAAANHLNAVVFQVRPEGDALYRSNLEPFSRFLTGTQGRDPGYDPLEFAVAEAHARGLELHAWINPYRASASVGAAPTASHMGARFSEHAHIYNGGLWMDPGATPVREHTVAVIADLVRRYDIDGVHFDDYFYPYPDNTQFPDDTTWAAYQASGGDLDRGDWRRDNVNRLVEAVATTIRGIDPDVRFGISPFGIYRPGIPEGIAGLDQYGAIFADPVRWLEAGWVDYLAPQLYWNATRPQQDYETLLRWWTSLTYGGHQIYVGNYLSQLGMAGWDPDEFRRQLRISRAMREAGSGGNIFFHIAPLVANQAGIADVLRAEFYPSPALTPPLAGRGDDTLAAPTVTLDGTTARLSHPNRLRAWVLYREDVDGWRVDAVRWAPLDAIELAPGTWAISAVSRGGVESDAVRVQVGG